MAEKTDAATRGNDADVDRDIHAAPESPPEDTKGEVMFVPEVDGKRGGTRAVDYLKGDAERHLTLFDKKASLINA